MTNKLLLIIGLLSITKISGQQFWQKINESPYFLTQSMGLDYQGNAYVSLHLHEGVYQFSFNKPVPNVVKMPKISPFRYDPQFGTSILLFLDIFDNVYAIRDAIPYKYKNEKFVLDSFTSPCNQNLPTAYEDTKMDEMGQLFCAWGSLYKYPSNWCLNKLIEILNQDSTGVVFDYFPYDVENNYAITKSNANNNTNVYKFNSLDFSYVKLFECDLNVFRKACYISPLGHIFLASPSGLLHYWDDGKKFEYSTVDSTFGPYVRTQGAFGSKNNDALVVKNNLGFYYSADNGLSWTKPVKLNNNFPEGEIISFEFYDSTKALASVKESCELYPRVFIIHPDNDGWEPLDIGESFMEINNIVKDKNSHLFAFINQCQWAVSKDEGRNWERLQLNGKPLKNLVLNDESELLAFEPSRDSTILYKSQDAGKTWSPFHTFEGVLLFVHNLKNNQLMAVTDHDTTTLRIPLYYYYLSNDNGLSWKLQNPGLKPIAPIGAMVRKQNDKIIAFDRNIVMHSLDQGKNWLLDPDFVRIKNMTRLYYDSDGKAIFFADLDGVKGIYLTSDFTNFNKISSTLPFEPSRMEYFGDGKIAVSGNRFPTYVYYSSDYGNSWTDLFKDLPLDYNIRVPFFTDFYMDDLNHLYLSNYHDGVYRTFNPLSSAKDIQKDHLVSIYPNPTSDQLTVSLNEEYTNFPVRLVMQNMLGQNVLEMELSNSQYNLNLKHLPAGIYALAIYHKGTLQHREMLMKK